MVDTLLPPDRVAFYISLYKHFHAHPELSNFEVETSKAIHSRLSSLPTAADFQIHTQIGGHGLVAILHNGAGPVVLLRADIDALPIKETTGLPYASVVTTDHEGSIKPVMHACGHDMHITCLLGAAEVLTSPAIRQHWSGTLLLVFQPAEERGSGANAMVNDPKWQRLPKPDILFGQHVVANLPAGTLGLRAGTTMAGAESLRITLHGRGGHASQPHRAIDVSVLTANIVVRLQQIVSRETDPNDIAVLTAIPLSSGAAENILPDTMEVGVDIRFTSLETRARLLAAIHRIVNAECAASNAPQPAEFRTTRTFPLTINDSGYTTALSNVFAKRLGNEQFQNNIPVATIAEDFPDLATITPQEGKKTATTTTAPYVFWQLGCADPDKFDLKGRHDAQLPPVAMNHSSGFAPMVEKTLEIGVEALVRAALLGFGEGEGEGDGVGSDDRGGRRESKKKSQKNDGQDRERKQRGNEEETGLAKL